MVALTKLNLPISNQAPIQNIDEDLFRVLNDLYLQLNNLTRLLDAAGIVLQSPNGHYWTVAISNAGVLTWTDAGTVRP